MVFTGETGVTLGRGSGWPWGVRGSLYKEAAAEGEGRREIRVGRACFTGEVGVGRGEGGSPHRPSLTVRQGLIALEADLEPEGAVERARILQHRHVQHRNLGHRLAGLRQRPQLEPSPRLSPLWSAG